MKKLCFKKPVLLRGLDLFGRAAWIHFEPAGKPGWYWRHSGVTVPIDRSLACYNKMFKILSLKHLGDVLHIYEHIGVLRWTGLDGVIITSSPWPPYHGRAWELWQALRPHLTETSEEVSWCEVTKNVYREYAPPRIGCTQVGVSETPNELSLRVSIDYKDLGRQTVMFFLPGDWESNMECILKAYTQGWPKWRYPIYRLASKWHWPHMDKVTWPKEANSLRSFLYHRVQDFLGSLSLVSHDKLPVCTAMSVKSGFEADLAVLRQVTISKRPALASL